jgi:copper transport protein
MSARPARGPPLRLLAAVGFTLLVSSVVVPGALAHADLQRSDPEDGSSLTRSPRSIRMWFTEGIVPRFSGGKIVAANGGSVRLASVQAEAEGRLVLTPASQLRRGLYTADWTVLSEEDGHIRRGFVVFGVDMGVAPATAGGRRDESVAPADVFLRWINFSLLAGLAGGLAVAFLVLTGTGASQARRRVLSWTLTCAVLGIAAGVALLLWQAATLARELGRGDSLVAVAWNLAGGTRLGALWLAREAILLALVALLLAVRRRGASRLAAVAAVYVVALAFVQALGGHAAAVTPRTGLAVAVAALHVLAAGAWIGGLVAGIVAFWPLRGEQLPLARASLRRFGILAALSVGVLGVTGLYYAGRQVASLDALLTTLYGQTLLVKLGLLLVAGAFGLFNAMLLHGRWSPVSGRRLKPLLVAEAAAGLAVLAAAALLTATLPARGPEFAPAASGIPTNVRSSRSVAVEDVVVTLSARPNRAGPNVFHVIAASFRRPVPAQIEGVELRFRRGEGKTMSAPMTQVAPGNYRLMGDYLRSPGAWRIDVVVKRGGPADVVAGLDWRAAPPEGPRPVVSDRPLGPFLVGASVVLGVLVLLAAAVVILRTFRSRSRWEGEPARSFRGM